MFSQEALGVTGYVCVCVCVCVCVVMDTCHRLNHFQLNYDSSLSHTVKIYIWLQCESSIEHFIERFHCFSPLLLRKIDAVILI